LQAAGKTLIVAETKNETLMKAFSNIPNARVVQVGELNAYDLLNGGKVVMLEAALAYTDKWAV
jgi:ribosomal protein L4